LNPARKTSSPHGRQPTEPESALLAAIVSFSDDAISSKTLDGVAPEHQEREFRIFERLHPAEAYPGTGVGLAIVKKAVQRMNGRMGVESEAGRSSCFWIELPRGASR